jgi:hypothetical protein
MLRRLVLLCIALSGGCQILGVAANAIPKPPVPAQLHLANQSVGVMVWCDRGLRVDFPTIQKDLGNGIQVRLNEALKAKAKEVEKMTFPYPPESFIRWQRDHPGTEYEQITDIAPRLHVSRLIYVEVEDFQTRASQTMAMYRGSATATIKVIAVEPNDAVGKIVYEEHNVKVVYPKKINDEGRPDGSDMKMYLGTMTYLSDAISERFVEHPAEDD